MKNRIKIHEIFKFIVTGASSTIIDFMIYFFLNSFVGVTIAKLISMLISCMYAFLINKVWTFQVEENIGMLHVVKYILAQCINISINVGTNTGIYYLTLNKPFAYIIATGMGMVCNFLLQKFFVFNNSEGVHKE